MPPEKPHDTDLQLAQDFQQGNREALGTLYRKYGDWMIKYASRFVDPNSADDIAHRVWVKTLENQANLPGIAARNSDGSLKPWLTRVTRNAALDYNKSPQQRRTTITDPVTLGDMAINHFGEQGILDTIEARLTLASILQILPILNKSDRELLQKIVNGYKYPKDPKECNAAKARVFRLRRKIMRELNKAGRQPNQS